jgi:hypothetical protein
VFECGDRKFEFAEPQSADSDAADDTRSFPQGKSRAVIATKIFCDQSIWRLRRWQIERRSFCATVSAALPLRSRSGTMAAWGMEAGAWHVCQQCDAVPVEREVRPHA